MGVGVDCVKAAASRRTPYKVLLEVQDLSFAERFPVGFPVENVGAPTKTHSKPN